jgi:hypothetical protein
MLKTHVPVPGAKVLAGEKPIGPANQAITYPLVEFSRLQVKSSVGPGTFKASFGPPLIVRAPGYSDEFVHYVLSSAL